MVKYSNERGECCLRTLIDYKRKRYDNALDVVVRLHDRPILSTGRTAPLRLAHVQHTFNSVTSRELTIQ